MAPPVRRPATYDDLVAVPDHLIAEIVDGELYTSPRPAPRHAAATTALAAALHAPFDAARGGPGGWRILFEPELHLGEDVLVPDVAAWRRERLPTLPHEAHFSIAPNWVCEVQSPSTAALDRGKKLRIYAREGVSHAWMVDPIAETLEVLRLGGGYWTIVSTYVGSDVVHPEPFQALGLELTLLWDEADERHPLAPRDISPTSTEKEVRQMGDRPIVHLPPMPIPGNYNYNPQDNSAVNLRAGRKYEEALRVWERIMTKFAETHTREDVQKGDP